MINPERLVLTGNFARVTSNKSNISPMLCFVFLLFMRLRTTNFINFKAPALIGTERNKSEGSVVDRKREEVLNYRCGNSTEWKDVNKRKRTSRERSVSR